MTEDPLEQLDLYYEGINRSPVPPRRRQTPPAGVWAVGGVACGALLAFSLLLMSSEPPVRQSKGIARAIAERQLQKEQPKFQPRSRRGVTSWGA